MDQKDKVVIMKIPSTSILKERTRNWAVVSGCADAFNFKSVLAPVLMSALMLPVVVSANAEKITTKINTTLIGTDQINSDRAGKETQVHELPSFSATLINYNRFDANSLTRSFVYMSKVGMRVVDVRGDNNQAYNEFIQNFQVDKVWLVSVERGVYVVFPVVDSAVGDTEDIAGKPNEAGGQLGGQLNDNGIMTIEPCGGNSGYRVGAATWRGYKVGVWECKDSDGSIVKQNYSLDWNLVVREEKSDGSISELQDLKAMQYSEKWFFPSDRYREIGIHEFVNGVPQISTYDDEVHGRSSSEETSIKTMPNEKH